MVNLPLEAAITVGSWGGKHHTLPGRHSHAHTSHMRGEEAGVRAGPYGCMA